MKETIVKLKHEKGNEGLGVIIGEQIITCAHILPPFSCNLEFSPEIEVYHVFSKEKYMQFFRYASTFDIATLGTQPYFVEYDDAPSEKAEIMYEEYGNLVTIFSNSVTDKKIEHKGYFYLPDGITQVDCNFKLSNSVSIWFESPHIQIGCSGGPLFNERNEVVGIISGILTGGEKGLIARAISVDIALPSILKF
jgi:hypothetical protein